ncbi:hypothetical protein [Promicromonospora sp. NPDC050249]|uniref:hypothetical protein n=1 Tax=Promicromonospora sp. NPDC050249 TaxID=3154743 RepID=UPI0033C4AF37
MARWSQPANRKLLVLSGTTSTPNRKFLVVDSAEPQVTRRLLPGSTYNVRFGAEVDA